MMFFLFFKIGQFLWELCPVFTVYLNIAKIVSLTGRNSERERAEINGCIKGRIMTYLEVLDLVPSSGRDLTAEQRDTLEEILLHNINVVTLSKKAIEILALENQRLKPPKKKIPKCFTPDFLQLKVDQSRCKCHFIINRDRLASGCMLSCTFPPFMS